MPAEAIIDEPEIGEVAPTATPGLNSMADQLNRLMSDFQKPAPAVTTEKPTATEAVKPTVPASVAATPEPTTPPVVTPPVVTPPATPAPATNDDLPESIRKSEKASVEFRKLREEKDTYRKHTEQLDTLTKDLRTQIATLEIAKTNPAPSPELEEVRKQNAELSKQLKIVAVERSDEFKTYFDTKTSAAVAQATAAAGADVAGKITKLLQLPDSAYRAQELDAILVELREQSPSKAALLERAVGDLHALTLERETALSRAATDYDALQKQQKAKQEASKAQSTERTNALVNSALDISKQLEAFKRDEKNPATNAAVNEREQFVRSFLSGQMEDKLVPFVPVLAAEAMHLRDKVLPALRDENAKLHAQIAAMTGAAPKPTAGSGDAARAAAGAAKPTFQEVYKKQYQQR